MLSASYLFVQGQDNETFWDSREEIVEVVYSVGVRFAGPGMGTTAYNAVRGIYRHSHLKRLIVSTRNCTEIPEYLISQIPMKAVAGKIAQLFHLPPSLASIIADTLVFDSLSALCVPECDIYHGWNHFALKSIRRCKQRGGTVTVVERASSHPTTASRLLSREYERWGLVYLRDDWFTRWNIRKSLTELDEADYVTVPSQFAYDSFVEHGFDQRKLLFIPFGVDTKRFRPRPKTDRVFRILFVGQLIIRKGVSHLLEAWNRLRLPNSELVLVGRPEKAILSLLKEYAQGQPFRLVGHVADPVDLFASASVFAFPSIEEGSALVTYEAMASALPVIVTHNAGSLAVDGEDGFIVPVGDAEAIAEKIELLYQNPGLRRAMGESARKRIEPYTWDRYGDCLVQAYERILDKRR